MRMGLILSVALALAACSGEAKKQTGGKADGEILPASVSDQMLPYDTVRSQAPLAPSSDGDEAGKDDKGAKPAEKQAAKPALEPQPSEPEEPAD